LEYQVQGFPFFLGRQVLDDHAHTKVFKTTRDGSYYM
jgi:hypothetical protein